MDDRRAGVLAVVVLGILCLVLWLVSDAPTCTERPPAGIMCTSNPR
jgi:hypothetical protein